MPGLFSCSDGTPLATLRGVDLLRPTRGEGLYSSYASSFDDAMPTAPCPPSLRAPRRLTHGCWLARARRSAARSGGDSSSRAARKQSAAARTQTRPSLTPTLQDRHRGHLLLRVAQRPLPRSFVGACGCWAWFDRFRRGISLDRLVDTISSVFLTAIAHVVTAIWGVPSPTLSRVLLSPGTCGCWAVV